MSTAFEMLRADGLLFMNRRDDRAELLFATGSCEEGRSPSDESRQWFAVRCRLGRECVARLELERQNLLVYLPQEQKFIRHARTMQKKPRPFFPGYLFLHLAAHERRWTAIRSTPGAICAVHFGLYYPPVSEQVIAALQGLEDGDGFIGGGEDPVSPFKPGERVVVRDGQFSGIEGLFVCRNGNERAMVLLEMLHRQVRAKLPLSLLTAV